MVNELACLNCGMGFTPTCHITRQKFSSSECRVRYNNAKRYYTDTPVNECPECGTPIKQSGEAGRWRRKFTDTLRSLPKELRSRSPAQTGLDFCNRLFALETEFSQQALAAEQRYAQRKQRSEPIAGGFFRWAQNEYEKNPVPKSLYGAALGYALQQQS